MCDENDYTTQYLDGVDMVFKEMFDTEILADKDVVSDSYE
jgi:hypothetical protein